MSENKHTNVISHLFLLTHRCTACCRSLWWWYQTSKYSLSNMEKNQLWLTSVTWSTALLVACDNHSFQEWHVVTKPDWVECQPLKRFSACRWRRVWWRPPRLWRALGANRRGSGQEVTQTADNSNPNQACTICEWGGVREEREREKKEEREKGGEWGTSLFMLVQLLDSRLAIHLSPFDQSSKDWMMIDESTGLWWIKHTQACTCSRRHKQTERASRV